MRESPVFSLLRGWQSQVKESRLGKQAGNQKRSSLQPGGTSKHKVCFVYACVSWGESQARSKVVGFRGFCLFLFFSKTPFKSQKTDISFLYEQKLEEAEVQSSNLFLLYLL